MNRRPRSCLQPSTTLQHLLGIEVLIAALAMAICLAATVGQAPALVDKTRASGHFLAVRPAQVEMVEWLAMQGELPIKAEPLLGMRPAWSSHEAAAHLLWLCGDRRPPAGFTAPPAAASAPLFSVCREERASW